MVEGKKNLPGEADKRNLVLLQLPERTKREAALSRSMDDLIEAVYELRLVEKMTGRSGLPERVCLAFSGALMSAVRLEAWK